MCCHMKRKEKALSRVHFNSLDEVPRIPVSETERVISTKPRGLFKREGTSKFWIDC